jgi:hypothetical protein
LATLRWYAAEIAKFGQGKSSVRSQNAKPLSKPLGHFEDKMKIGNRIKVTGGYDINPKWLKGKDGYHAKLLEKITEKMISNKLKRLYS